MAGIEVIGVVAAAGQLIEQTIQVVRLVQEVRSKARNPGRTQQWISEIETLKDLATQVQQTAVLQTPPIKDILRRCDDHSRSLCSILATIACEADANVGKKTWAAIQGVAQEGKIKALFDGLEREKSSLIAYIATTNLSVAESTGKQLKEIHVALQNIPTLQNAGGGCLADLRCSCTDPSDDKRRIEDRKGGLLKDSYQWILHHSDFQRWLRDDQSRLLWIKGDAGKGKTMLLCGIIDEFEASRRPDLLPHAGLISYFFCEATDTRLRSSTAVLKGLIYLLLARRLSLTHHLEAKYQHAGKQLFDDTNVNAFSALSGILDNLLCDPALPPTYLFIDALDECQDGLSELLRYIRRAASSTATSQVRWVLTSRNWHEIQQELSFEDARTTLSLELNADHVSRAIDVYIHYKVSQLDLIRHDQDLQHEIERQLRDKADGTFLWVALVFQQLLACKLISKLLPLMDTMPPGLLPLYARMMEEISKSEDRTTCQRVLSTATLASRPLHLLELRTLAGIRETDDMEKAVSQCASFLTIRQDRVYLIHQSAKDYLVEHTPETVFPDGEAGAHGAILLQSVQEMSASLHRDMYDLQQSGSLIAEMRRPYPDPLSPIRYACVYWIDHFFHSHIVELEEGVLQFLSDHLLHWVESLSLMGVLSDGILSVRRLLHKLQTVGTSPSSEAGRSFGNIFSMLESRTDKPVHTLRRLAEFLADALKFLLAHGLVIEQAPLQTYSAALALSPVNSITRKTFWNQRLSDIQTTWDTNGNWDPCLQMLTCYDGVDSVAFSPDGKTLASGSSDNIVRLWDGVTGKERQTLEGHSGRVLSVAFSLDGKTLMSGSSDNTVQLWDRVTGKERQTLIGHSYSVHSVAFSPDGKTLASGSNDKTIRLWDTEVRSGKWVAQGHNTGVKSIAFSSGGRKLISTAEDGTVWKWDVVTGKPRRAWRTSLKDSPGSHASPSSLSQGRDSLDAPILVKSFLV